MMRSKSRSSMKAPTLRPRPWLVPPGGMKASVGADDALALLHGRRDRPLADDLMRVGEILEEDVPAGGISVRRVEAPGKQIGRREGSDVHVEGCLPARCDVDAAVGTGGLEEQSQPAGATVEIDTQAPGSGDQRLPLALDDDLSDLIVVELPGRTQEGAEVDGIQHIGAYVRQGSRLRGSRIAQGPEIYHGSWLDPLPRNEKAAAP